MDKKPGQDEKEEKKSSQKLKSREAEKPGWKDKLFMTMGQKLGVREKTRLEPRFERNIEKLVNYHNIIYRMVDAIELQVQTDPKRITEKQVVSPANKNSWELLGGWLRFLAMTQFTGEQRKIVDMYSCACGKISMKEALVQRRTRSHLIKSMRLYVCDSSVELNRNVAEMNNLLFCMDEARHRVKNSQTLPTLKAHGNEYAEYVNGFNETANKIQESIDEVVTVATLHQMELLKFSREVSMLNDSTFNSLNEVILRLGYRVDPKK